MRYRQESQSPDAELAALIRSSYPATIVLNGDVFDLDAPDLRGIPVRDRSERASSALIGAILDDHPLVAEALRQAALVVVIPGNHDAQLAFPAVQNVLRTRLGPRIRFERLFYQTPDGFHIEHGHQYDPLCSINGPSDDSIGTVVTFYTPLMFGCASPYASDPLETNWVEGLCGCASTELTMAFLRDLLLVGAGAKRNIEPLAASQHIALFAPKTLANAVIEERAWQDYGPEACRRLRIAARQIAQIYGVRGVVFGHTHVAVDEGVYCNSGSWVRTSGMPPSYVWIENGVATQRYW